MGQATSSNALGVDAQGLISTYHAKAWIPYLRWSGDAAPQIIAGLQSLSSSSSPAGIKPEQLASSLGLTAAQCALLLAAWERAGPAEVVAPIIRTGVSTSDFLIVLNILVEDENSTAAGPAMLEGVSTLTLEKVQESLDQTIEARGPEGENEAITPKILSECLGRGVPLMAWAALIERLVKGVAEQEMGGENGIAAAATHVPGAANAVAASSSSSSSAVAASSSSSAKKPAAAKSSGGMGGGLDLSISGFSIKPPSKPASAAKK